MTTSLPSSAGEQVVCWSGTEAVRLQGSFERLLLPDARGGLRRRRRERVRRIGGGEGHARPELGAHEGAEDPRRRHRRRRDSAGAPRARGDALRAQRGSGDGDHRGDQQAR